MYEFRFDPITDQTYAKAATLIGKTTKRAVKGINSVIDPLYPKPYEADNISWFTNTRRAYDCGIFDAILVVEFESKYGTSESNNNRLTRAEAETFLNTIKRKYTTNANKFYPETTKNILDTADSYARDHWTNGTISPEF